MDPFSCSAVLKVNLIIFKIVDLKYQFESGFFIIFTCSIRLLKDGIKSTKVTFKY